jgi:2-oxoisovalerate dehydrogenase E1 component alpha subunit
MASSDLAAGTLERHGLSDEQLSAIFRNMLLQRQLDNRGFQLNRQGKVPFALGSEGHEALQAGAAMAFNRGRDILAPYYRALGLMSFSSILAAHLPHAVGAAYALKYRGESGRAVLATCGDGTTSEGEWHESMNFAAVHKLPYVMLVENNEWAISTPLEKQMAEPQIYKRAAGYGMPGRRFNGIDPIETYAAVKEAMDRARSGGGPTLVEGCCYRYLAHSTDDNDMTYRTREAVLERRKQDPVPAFEAVLVEHGILTPEQVAEMRKSVLRETNEATDAAEAQPYPTPADLYVHVYEGAWQPWQS